MAAVLSSSGLAVSLSGIGVIVGAPLAGIAGLLGFISTTMTVGSKKPDKKITKHGKTVSLAEAKYLLINKLISKAFNDGLFSDVEFDLIIQEVDSTGLKETISSDGVSATINFASSLKSVIFSKDRSSL